MQLVWLNPLLLSDEHWQALCAGGEPGGWTPAEIAEQLLSKRWMAFACDGGAFAVETVGTRLYVRVLAIDGFGWRMRSFRDVMDRLASDMGCDTVETTVFSERLMQAMVRIRAKPEAWNMVWQVEGTGDGQ
jgi:23S rRNA C2498 (ribose-2'-O)-methylase RlmM